MTFSLVARAVDARTGTVMHGIAVASKFLAVGSVVPGARAEVGAVATQSLANLRYIPDALALMADGLSAQEALDTVTAADDQRDLRQAGAVDAQGRSATFTGKDCYDWAGGRVGDGWAAQGNILTGPEVVDAMVAEWTSAPAGNGASLEGLSPTDMARALVRALLAGDRAGGDSRGRQSAAVMVVCAGGGYMGGSDVAVDLRVDDHADPVPELIRLLDIHELLFGSPDESALLPIRGEVATELASLLAELGYPDPDLDRSLASIAGVENLEERIRPGLLDPVVREHLRNLCESRRKP